MSKLIIVVIWESSYPPRSTPFLLEIVDTKKIDTYKKIPPPLPFRNFPKILIIYLDAFPKYFNAKNLKNTALFNKVVFLQ